MRATAASIFLLGPVVQSVANHILSSGGMAGCKAVETAPCALHAFALLRVATVTGGTRYFIFL